MWDWDRGAATFGEAARVSPSDASARQWYALNCLAPQGRIFEAREALDAARALDPLSHVAQVSDGFLKYLDRDVAAATAVLTPLLAEPDCPPITHLFLGFVHQLSGQYDLARRAFRTAEAVGGRTAEALTALATNQALAGDLKAARRLLAEMVAISDRRYVSPGRLAEVHAAVGDWDEARDHWKEAIRIRSTDLIWIGVSPVYDFARGREEFEDVVAAVGAARH